MSPIRILKQALFAVRDQLSFNHHHCEVFLGSHACYNTEDFHFGPKSGRPFGSHRRLKGYACLAESALHRFDSSIKASSAVS